jgi:protein-disulfide isomerase
MSPKQPAKDTKSKRQVIREQRQKQAQQQRVIIIGAIIVIALLLAGVVVWPSIQRNQNIVKVTPNSYATANGTAIGDPNAPVKIQIFEDFKCHACQSYTNNIEPRDQ